MDLELDLEVGAGVRTVPVWQAGWGGTRLRPVLAAMLVSAAATLTFAEAAVACERIELVARVSDDLRRVDGIVTCDNARVAPAAVATYPRILRQPVGLNDINREWYYPRGFEPAEMSLWFCPDPACLTTIELTGDGVWQALPPAHASSVRLRFATRVPRRNGAFGRHRNSVYLLGGWHPAFGDGTALWRRPLRYRVSLPPGFVGLIGDQPVKRSRNRHVQQGETQGRFLPIFLTRSMTVDRAGGSVILTPQPFPRSDSKEDTGTGLNDVTANLDTWAREHLAETLAFGAATARRWGIPERPLFVIRGPIRENLVESFDGGLLVALGAFHLLGLERIMKFHRLPLWRGQLGAYLLPLVAARESALPGGVTVDMIADAIAASLRDRIRRERYGQPESAADILEWFAFIPEIDALVFAPQVPFADAFYEAIDETPTVRRRLDDFYHQGPRGKLLGEKLKDALGEETVFALFDRYLRSDDTWLDTLAGNGAGRDPVAVIEPWLGAYPRLDYALGEVRAAGGEITAEVEADGPDAGQIIEPITVAITDDRGDEHRVTRLGPGRVSVRAPDGRSDFTPSVVRLDPDGRLVEHHRREGEGPRFNNRAPPRWRLLLNNITGLFAITNGEVHAAADFGLRRLHDLAWAFQLWAIYQPDAWGGGATASWGFGREITPLRLAHRVYLSPAYQRLRGTESMPPGDQISLGLTYAYDDRRCDYWSYEGRGLRLRATGALAWDREGRDYQYAQVGAAALQIFPLAFGHALVGRLSADFEIGESPPQKGLVLGHRYRGARGFEFDEVRGERRILVSGEYRHIFSADGRTDFFGLVTFTRFEGALFADLANLPVDRDGCHQQMFYDIGYGLRFMGDILNVAPASIQIDFGVPLNRCPDERQRWPVTIYIAVLQSFETF